MKTFLVSVLFLLLSFHQIRAQQRPIWHFNLIVGISQETVDHYGGFQETKNLVHTQIQTVNTRFNQSVFEGEIQFIIDSVYVFNNDPVNEAFVPHPNHSYRIIYHCIARPGGGWYGPPRNAICHIWSKDNWGGTFGDYATDGITHEFGHSRGAIDVYALKVTADNNPINGQEYKPPTSIMNYPYGVTVWDTHSINLINTKADSVNKTAKYITTAFPTSIVVNTIGSDEMPLPNTQINLYPVNWFSYGVSTIPYSTVLTSEQGEYIFTSDSNPFEPDAEGKPWKIKYPNFLLEARFGNTFAYQWMPLIDVQNYYFSNPGTPYELTLELETMTVIENCADKPEHFWLSQNSPNPFNSNTKILYSIPNSQYVTLKVFDMLGREVATLVNVYQKSGNHEVTFDASTLGNGIYFYRLQAENLSGIKKMILLK